MYRVYIGPEPMHGPSSDLLATHSHRIHLNHCSPVNTLAMLLVTIYYIIIQSSTAGRCVACLGLPLRSVSATANLGTCKH